MVEVVEVKMGRSYSTVPPDVQRDTVAQGAQITGIVVVYTTPLADLSCNLCINDRYL